RRAQSLPISGRDTLRRVLQRSALQRRGSRGRASRGARPKGQEDDRRNRGVEGRGVGPRHGLNRTVMRPVGVRPARPGDLEAIVRLCADHAEYEKGGFERDGKTEALREVLFAGVPRLWCFVAEADGAIVSYASGTRDFSTWRGADYLHLDCL